MSTYKPCKKYHVVILVDYLSTNLFYLPKYFTTSTFENKIFSVYMMTNYNIYCLYIARVTTEISFNFTTTEHTTNDFGFKFINLGNKTLWIVSQIAYVLCFTKFSYGDVCCGCIQLISTIPFWWTEIPQATSLTRHTSPTHWNNNNNNNNKRILLTHPTIFQIFN